MLIIESILRSRVVKAFVLATVLGTFSLNVPAETSTLTPADIIDREVEIAKQYFHDSNFTEALNRYGNVISRSIAINGKQHRDIARYRNDVGVIYLSMEKYPEARDTLMQAAGIIGKIPGDPNSATIYRNLGATFYHLGDYEKALDWNQKASAVSGAESPAYGDIAIGYEGTGISEEICAEALMIQKHNIGIEHLNTGKYTKARDILMQAAEIGEKRLSNINSDKVAVIYGSLGVTFNRLNDYGKALDWHQKALAIQESVLGAESLSAADTYENIGSVYERQRDYQTALDWYIKTQTVREKRLGTDHPSVAAIYDRIAGMHRLLGEQDKAQEWLQKAVAIRDKTKDNEDADAASTHHSAALVHSGQGDYENALELHKQALAIEEKTHGKQHPVTIAIRNDIAGVYAKKGDYKQAAIWYRQVLADQEKVLGKGHFSTAATYSNIAVAEARLGDNTKSLENLRKAVVIFEKSAGKDHPGTATVYTNMAWVYSRMRNYGKAEEWARKAMEINEKAFGKEHPSVGTSHDIIAMAYMNRRQYDKAVSGYLQAYRIYLTNLGEGYPQTQSVKGNLKKAYDMENAHKRIKNPKPFDDWLTESMVGYQVESGPEPSGDARAEAFAP